MKNLITIVAVALFSAGMNVSAQETKPKETAKKETVKKECSAKEKKACDKSKKSCCSAKTTKKA